IRKHTAAAMPAGKTIREFYRRCNIRQMGGRISHFPFAVTSRLTILMRHIHSLCRAGALLALAVIPAFSQGISATIAGSSWVFPDGVPAVDAPLSQVLGVVVDSNGVTYIGDGGNGELGNHQ